MSRQVASLSNQGAKNVPPRFVSAEARKIGTEVRCDCPVYRSSPNICQHALAAAEDLGVLPKFLQWVRKTKKSSNLSLLIADSVPKTGGEKSTTRRKGAPRKKQGDKQDLSLPNPSPYSFSNYYPPFQPSAWRNEYTQQPPQFGPCPVGFQFQSPVYAQSVDMYSNCQLATSTDTNPTEWFRLHAEFRRHAHSDVLWLQQPNSYGHYHCSPSTP